MPFGFRLLLLPLLGIALLLFLVSTLDPQRNWLHLLTRLPHTLLHSFSPHKHEINLPAAAVPSSPLQPAHTQQPFEPAPNPSQPLQVAPLRKPSSLPLPADPSPRLNCPRLQVLRGGSCVDATPSCQLTDAARHDCVAGPSSCECLAECEAAFHLGVPSASSPPLIPCFYSNSSRLGSLDDALARPWFWFPRARTVAPGCDPLVVPESYNPAAGQPIELDQTRLLSAAKCEKACNGRGWCTLQRGTPACSCFHPWGGPTCSCSHPWTGPACAQISFSTLHRSDTCLNACSGAGRCQQGVCLCIAGRWGIDCSLPLTPSRHAPAADVYIYELPSGLNSWWGHVAGRDLGRTLHAALLRSPYRTTDPERASVFWVPVEPVGLVSYGQALLALEYVRQAFPYYNRSQGRDHAIAYGWDSGSCWIANHPLAINTIQISNFGLDKASDKMSCNCPLCGPGFSLLVPDIMEQHYKQMSRLQYGQAADSSPRPTWVFFSGGISGPERAALAALVANDSFRLAAAAAAALPQQGEVRVSVGGHSVGRRPEGTLALGEGMREAKFCLAPPGAGFGTRGTLAILLGCVPVYIGELRQPWDDVLDYSTFSLRVPLHQLPQLLGIVAAADYEGLKAGLGRVWHMFSWASVFGPVGGEPLQHDALHLMLAAARRQAKQRVRTLSRPLAPGGGA